jgi:hypothetical protein
MSKMARMKILSLEIILSVVWFSGVPCLQAGALLYWWSAAIPWLGYANTEIIE